MMKKMQIINEKHLRDATGRFVPKPVDFNNERALGHLCGLLLGDGKLFHSKKTNNYCIKIKTTKMELIRLFEKSFHEVLPKNNLCFYTHFEKRTFPNHTTRTDCIYEISTNSKILFGLLKPCKKADFHWDIPTFLGSEDFLLGFAQGIFDAEGYVTRRRWESFSYLLIGLCSKHKDNLESIKHLLEKWGINSRIYRHGHTFELRIISKRDVQLFKNLIGFRLSSKSVKLCGECEGGCVEVVEDGDSSMTIIRNNKVKWLDTPWGQEAICPHCGSDLMWIECEHCEDGYSYHDCGEDTCCC
jgi:intein-encoded DNA endonuclease-like protein